MTLTRDEFVRPDPKDQRLKELDHIVVRGAREHNLKNVDVDLPKKKLVVLTGVSGSGKSSLAFDTIFAEGQRRYVESLSSYARQFLGQMEKPKFDTIRGLSPTIAIEQKAASKNPRSTVGTITEVYDYLRVLYARIGTQHCHLCGKTVGRGDASTMVDQILRLEPSTRFMLLAPLVNMRKGEYKDLFANLKEEGFPRARVNGVVSELTDIPVLAKHKKHTIEAVIDRLEIKAGAQFRLRLTDSVETALKKGKGNLIVHVIGGDDIPMSESRSCCGFAFPELDPPLFSFNSPLGMCEECDGLGSVFYMDERKLVPDDSVAVRAGAVVPWAHYFENGKAKSASWGFKKLNAIEKHFKMDFSVPWKKMPKKHRDILLNGAGDKRVTINWESQRSQGSWDASFAGIIPTMMKRYFETESEDMIAWYEKFMSYSACQDCHGKRLKPQVLAVRVGGSAITELTALSIRESHEFVKQLTLTENQRMIARDLLSEIVSRLGFLVNVGLDYLSLDRGGPTLSGGEAQRIRLASQIGSELTGVLYILDEPSIGLHQRDNKKLIETLCHLRDIGNSLLVVEHDQETMEACDWIVDIGPGAGHEGGRIVAAGTPDELRRNPHSLTGMYLGGKLSIETPAQRRPVDASGNRWIEIKGATENNLKNLDVRLPLGVMSCITGVSGAGKSTLINQILFPALSNRLHKSDLACGVHSGITGLEHLDKIINIDQKPIGRTPRSNPATYTKVFDLVRDFFALLPEAKVRGYQKGRFSFNVKGGRCEQCQGDGYITVEMHFLADVLIPCEVCKGKRFNDATLQVKYKGSSIADVLDMSVTEGRELFQNHPKIATILDTLIDVGLGYIKLGQAATTLSGGEAQRIKLARELARADTGRTLYILDEPTTGLHFEDIRKLLGIVARLVDHGNTVIVIEHNLDVIKCADWLLDMGPEGGQKGGQIIGQGTPEQLCAIPSSHTGVYLKTKILPSL